MIKRHPHSVKRSYIKGYSRPGAKTTRSRRLKLWIQGTCLQNRQWFLRKSARMGHDATGHTVWDKFCPPGTVEAQ
jgi:hypothetical protein